MIIINFPAIDQKNKTVRVQFSLMSFFLNYQTRWEKKMFWEDNHINPLLHIGHNSVHITKISILK